MAQGGGMSGHRWKVSEVQRVDEATLERTLNAAAEDGWELERIDYIKEFGVRRPAMAYLYFTRPVSAEGASDAGDEPNG
jgi:hypothetical protein